MDNREISIRPYRQSDRAAIERIHDSARKIELKLADLSEAFLPLSIAAERENLTDYDGLFVTEAGVNIDIYSPFFVFGSLRIPNGEIL